MPGLLLPSLAEVLYFKGWAKASFLKKFAPDPSWKGCADKIGAIDCKTGKLRARFKPFAGYSVNKGYGWAGPLIVKQRYPLP